MKSRLMILAVLSYVIVSGLMVFTVPATAQVGSFTRDDLIAYTSEWKGERLSDGRPKVSDDIIERMKIVPVTLAWSVLSGEGYESQYDGSEWTCIHPGEVLVGRALTVRYMPMRPQVDKVNQERAPGEGRQESLYSWGLDMLQEGDVYVADGFGKHVRGALIGDNYAAAIFANSKNGAILNSSVRDLEGIAGIPGFNAYVRSWHPTAVGNVMMMGVNCPVLIGEVTVMPGDVVLAKPEGIVFIPPHLVEKVLRTAEINSLRDTFGIQRIIEKRYTLNQIHGSWIEEIELDFVGWLNDNADSLPVPRNVVDEYIGSMKKK